MIAYKFRAECFIDVLNMLVTLSDANTAVDNVEIRHTCVNDGRDILPDREVSLQINLALTGMQEATASVEDGHVMRETVQTAENYTGERETV